jgi:hypothetical protein
LHGSQFLITQFDDLQEVLHGLPQADESSRLAGHKNVFPSADVTLRYYASGMIDAIVDPQADNSHRSKLLELVGEGVHSIIAQEGVFRDPKPAGCFVVRND